MCSEEPVFSMFFIVQPVIQPLRYFRHSVQRAPDYAYGIIHFVRHSGNERGDCGHFPLQHRGGLSFPDLEIRNFEGYHISYRATRTVSNAAKEGPDQREHEHSEQKDARIYCRSIEVGHQTCCRLNLCIGEYIDHECEV